MYVCTVLPQVAMLHGMLCDVNVVRGIMHGTRLEHM